MRTCYGVFIQSSEEVGFMYSGGLSLLCCEMYVIIQCMRLIVIASRLHTVLQELYLRTACTFHFDLTEIAFIKLLVLH